MFPIYVLKGFNIVFRNIGASGVSFQIEIQYYERTSKELIKEGERERERERERENCVFKKN